MFRLQYENYGAFCKSGVVMRSKIQNTILTTFLIVGLAACSPGGDQPAPEPDPAPQPAQPPPPPVPPPPDGTDYTKPGTHGKTGVETDEDEKPVIDVDKVAEAIVQMAVLPLEMNVQFMTFMATKMPYIGRG